MMTEKLKIYVSSRVASVIEKDAEGFEFYKKDGRTLNKNALLTRLIVNYHRRFAAEQEELFSFLKQKLAPVQADAKGIDEICFAVCERWNERRAAPDGEKFDVPVSIKPTRESEPVIDYIERYSLAGRTLSEYIRGMFSSYAALPQDKREEIVFQPQYDAVTKAIREKKKVYLTTRKGAEKGTEIAPYAIARSKEEMHLYVIGAQRACLPVRLSRITAVTILTADAVFDERQVALAEKMIRYGPQFFYRFDEEEVLVELTERGMDKYQKIYVHRPVPVKVEGNRYYFCCSHSQIVQYFVRFGGDAEIIYPEKMREDICFFHRRALAKYRKKKREEE